jgi:4a-hydroxytetrahydrobiopterin dehydratase
MTERITPRQFHEAVGVEDWRVLGDGACTYFRTGSFEVGARLVQAIAGLGGFDDHHPDVDLRYEGVTVRLITMTDGSYGLSERDVELARQISAVARDLGTPADPSVQSLEIAIDALVRPEVMPFWRAVLGYRDRGDGDDNLIDPRGRGPLFWFQQMDAPRPQRNRIHIDVWVPHDQAEERVAAAIAAGGVLVTDEHAPSWWTLADAEGNEADVCTWQSTAERIPGDGRRRYDARMARTPDQLWGPIAKAQLVTRRVTAGTGFGNTEGLRISGKIFAMLVGSELVVKLPKDRVDELVDSGIATRFDAGKGRPMKEWASIAPSASRRWKALVEEARAFVGLG